MNTTINFQFSRPCFWYFLFILPLSVTSIFCRSLIEKSEKTRFLGGLTPMPVSGTMLLGEIMGFLSIILLIIFFASSIFPSLHRPKLLIILGGSISFLFCIWGLHIILWISFF